MKSVSRSKEVLMYNKVSKFDGSDVNSAIRDYFENGGVIHVGNVAVAKMGQHYNKDVHQSRLSRKEKARG